MPCQKSSGNVFGRQRLIESAAVKIGALFDNHQPFSDQRRGDTKTDSETGSKNLGKRADINHIVRRQGMNRGNIIAPIT